MENKTLMFYINAIHDGGAERVMLQASNCKPAQRFLLEKQKKMLKGSC